MNIEWNLDLTTCPGGKHVFLLLKVGEKGHGELAVGMICRIDDEPIACYWTWGGPYSGFGCNEVPIAWAHLPTNWREPLHKDYVP